MKTLIAFLFLGLTLSLAPAGASAQSADARNSESELLEAIARGLLRELGEEDNRFVELAIIGLQLANAQKVDDQEDLIGSLATLYSEFGHAGIKEKEADLMEFAQLNAEAFASIPFPKIPVSVSEPDGDQNTTKIEITPEDIIKILGKIVSLIKAPKDTVKKAKEEIELLVSSFINYNKITIEFLGDITADEEASAARLNTIETHLKTLKIQMEYRDRILGKLNELRASVNTVQPLI